jgi:hypothetical protein
MFGKKVIFSETHRKNLSAAMRGKPSRIPKGSIRKQIVCPHCNKVQLTLISVTVCEAGTSLWYKCSVNKTCKLFQIKNI